MGNYGIAVGNGKAFALSNLTIFLLITVIFLAGFTYGNYSNNLDKQQKKIRY